MLGTLGVVVAVTAGTAAVWQVPYYTISPGSVWPTEDLVSVDGADTFASDGQIGFTTVSLSSQRTSALEAFLGWLDPAVEVVDEELILGDDTPDENRERQLQYMLDSKQQATAVALETLGYDVARPSGARVLDVDPTLPAADILEVGDVIVGLDGEPIEAWDEVVAGIAAHQPGDEVTLDIERPTDATDTDPEELTVSATLAGRPPPDDPSLPVLGIIGTDAVVFDFPFEVDIDSGAVGGPSAGLAFTLALLDVLTPEDLTGGQLVATTGTISLDGTVGPVGGVAQKTVAARRAGVDLFIVPSVELDEATAVAGDMDVAAADTIEEALAALEQVGVDTDELQSSAQAALGR